MLRLHPSSTLFPYTTLFRSDTGYAGSVHFTSNDTSAGVALPADSTLTDGQATFAATLTTAGSQTITGTDTVTMTITDRKSTRLNSSHLVISYAVFCLKKKIK